MDWRGSLSASDGADAGPKREAALKRIGRWTLEIVKRSASAQGFEVLPRRWVVERTLARLNHNRRLAKDFEATIATAKAWLFLACYSARRFDADRRAKPLRCHDCGGGQISAPNNSLA